jgi:nucleoside triphosphate diphosphatase
MPLPGHRFTHLVEIMRTLRSPGGCPWDREQTLRSLRPFLLEECYEALEAIDRHDMTDLREEVGDLLFEIVFLAQVAEDERAFTIDDAIETVSAKLVRRHPHVFGDAESLRSADEVLGRWEDLKRDERAAAGAAPKATLEGVPRTLPGLLRAYEYGSRAATQGFDWVRAEDVIAKIREEIDEVEQVVRGTAATARSADTNDALEEEVGDLLFAIANLSRRLGVEPETALRRANDKFAARFTALERRVRERGAVMKDEPLDALEAEWQVVKGTD